ncbi:biotin synthase BioB [Peptococcaceae bacterium 1198_IL3148]
MLKLISEKISAGNKLSYEEALYLSRIKESNLADLISLTSQITARFCGSEIDTCSIINAKSGRCSEDCKFCAQSAHFNTGCKDYPLMNCEMVLQHAKKVEQRGINRFAIVTSGKELSNSDFEKIISIYKTLRENTTLNLCASLGLLDEYRATKLKNVGVTTYHHNLETAESYFPNICTTHTYQQRVNTIKAVQNVGLRVCSGGIISIGETMEQRLELAYQLKELNVESVPINILNPISGTPLENQVLLSPLEIIKTICIFRLILPNVTLRFAGGVKNALGELRVLGYLGGINASIIGDFLTTPGADIDKELQLINQLRYSKKAPK